MAPLLESVSLATGSPHRVLFVLTEGDEAERAAVRACGADYVTLPGPHGPGDYARKINLAARESDEALLFLGADDLAFHPGWLEAATAHLSDVVHVIGTNDLGNPRVLRGEHSTHSLLTRAYANLGTIDEPDKVLHEDYPHEYVDDEFVATARARGAFAFAASSIVEHLHPHWGKGATDELYDAHRRRMRQGRRVFDRRRHLWDNLTSR